MKQMFYIVLLCISIAYSQVPPGKSFNSCGKEGLGYEEPKSADDCKESGKICCYIETKKYGKNFCAIVSSKVDDDEDIVKKIKEYTEDDELKITCNNCFHIQFKYIVYTVFCVLLYLF